MRGATAELLALAVLTTVGCAGASAGPRRPAPQVEAVLRRDALGWMECEEALVEVSPPHGRVVRECVEYGEREQREAPHPHDIIGDLTGSTRPCRRWGSRRVGTGPDWWRVRACGQIEEFYCYRACPDSPLACVPSYLVGRIDVSCGRV